MSTKKQTVFVTGGGGYVASHCILELLREGYDVVAVDNFSNSIEGASDLPESLIRVQKLAGRDIKFYKADLCDKESLRSAMSKHKIDCVIHFAALKAVGESCKLPLKYYNNNVSGSCNLMEVMMELGLKKIVFSSSATVYGDPQYLPVDEKHPAGQGCTNPYGKSKFFTEEIMKDVCAANDDWCCLLLRYFNPVGAHPSGQIGEDPRGEPCNLMPYVAQVAVGRLEKVTVYGDDYDTPDKTGVRDYIHVMDLASGHVAAVQYQLRAGCAGAKVFNLGTGKGASVLEVIGAFEKASGKRIPYKFAPRRTGDVACVYSSCQLAEQELGWKAKLTLPDMCKDMWTWQSQNPNGFLKQK